MTDDNIPPMSKRDLLAMIGKTAGATAIVYGDDQLRSGQGLQLQGPIKLDGDPNGKSVLILGAGVAGMTAGYELSKAGYKVQILEYNGRVGGRSWTLKGGDTFTELGGLTQKCDFAPGNYINPGPWRIPWHHHGLIHYCHGVRRRARAVHAGQLQCLCAFDQAVRRQAPALSPHLRRLSGLCLRVARQGGQQGALNDTLTKEDGEILLESLRSFGGLDKNMRYAEGRESSNRRGWEKEPGGGLPPSRSRPSR